MNKSLAITIFDIARASGVSYSTVSRVLNGFEFVKADTRERVQKTADSLGYVANQQARSLAGGKSQIIGMLVPSLDNGYTNAISRGIDEELAKAGYDLMLYTTHHKRGKESRYVQTIANGLSEGLLLMVPLIDNTTSEVSKSTYLDTLRASNFPYVLIDQTDPANQSTVVDSTNWQGAYDATLYLIELGHRHIGFISGKIEINAAKERFEGYKAALASHSLEFDKNLIAEGEFHAEVGYLAAKKILAQDPLPTALLASNDMSAFGAMDAIRDKGLRIPHDISVIGFDDIAQASITYPKLTTVRQPLDEMGRVAVKLLLEKLEHPDTPIRCITLATSLIIRDSTRALNQ